VADVVNLAALERPRVPTERVVAEQVRVLRAAA
jgi:NitT/TauT family transport system ATP-binding protein